MLRAAMLKRPGSLLMLLALAAPALHAQDALVLPRLTGPVTLDGLSDEPAWQAVAPLPLVTYEPVFEAAPSERTEIRIAYDDGFLYVAGRLYDSHPAGIRANSLYRDRYSGDDVFAVILDTFDDNENALWFFTTPAGTRFDMAVSNDVEFTGGDPFGGVINASWNTFWDAAAVQTPEGWFAEMRIPFSSLGFQDADGRVEMGLIAYRFISRLNERHLFPKIPPNWMMGFAKPSQAQTVVLDGVYSRKPLYVAPYALSGLGQQAALDDAEAAYHTRRDLTGDLGLDLKYSLTSNLTLDLTVNTDFAQVEADDQQVNLTRFSLFFPEKRQFFQERAGIFDFSTTGQSRLFHSRRIGLSEDGVVPILGGVRLVGRVGRWDVGLIEMQTDRAAGLPSENFGVARLRRQVFNPFSYAGALVTSRVGTEGAYNVAYGLDGVVRIVGDEYLTVKWAQTFDRATAEAAGFDALDSGRLLAEWRRRRGQGLSYGGVVAWSGPAYDPGVGFTTREDFTHFAGNAQYDLFAAEASRVRRWQPTLWANVYWRNTDGAMESAAFSHFTNVELKSGTWLFGGANLLLEDVLDGFELSDDAEVLPGRYWFYDGWVGYFQSMSTLFRLNADVRGGTFYDGWWLAPGLGPTWSLSQHLEVAGQYQLNHIRFPDRDQQFTAHIGRVRLQAALNTRVSLNAFLQYNSAADAVSLNARFRYHFREGNDLWLVYNEGLNTDRHASLPVLPRTDTRTILLKYTYTFAL